MIKRKERLAGIFPAQTGIVCSTLTIEEHGQELFEAVCGLDLEGIIAKRNTDPYDARTRWLKSKNPRYSQAEGRRELFDRWAEREELSPTSPCTGSPLLTRTKKSVSG